MDAPPEKLTDDVVTLVRWRLEDAAELAAVAGPAAARIAEYLPWAVGGYGHEDAVAFLTRSAQHWASGETYDFAIRTADGTLAGGAGLIVRDDHAEIGYWIGDRHHGHGLVTRAAALLTAEVLRLGAGHVEIRHDAGNARSAAVPRRLGYTRAATIPGEGPHGTLATGTHVIWRKDP